MVWVCEHLPPAHERGMYSVMALKTCHSNFPKDELLAKVQSRFDFACMTRWFNLERGRETKLLAGAWMDKKEMLVVASCTDDSPTPPVERLRTKFKDGRVQKLRYDVQRRKYHAFYREHFNGIDVLNKFSIRSGIRYGGPEATQWDSTGVENRVDVFVSYDRN